MRYSRLGFDVWFGADNLDYLASELWIQCKSFGDANFSRPGHFRWYVNGDGIGSVVAWSSCVLGMVDYSQLACQGPSPFGALTCSYKEYAGSGCVFCLSAFPGQWAVKISESLQPRLSFEVVIILGRYPINRL